MPKGLQNRKKNTFTQNQFYGMNLRGRDDDLHPFEACLVTDAVFSRGNKPGARPGRFRCNTSALSAPITSFGAYQPEGGIFKFFIDSGGKTYYDDSLSGTYTLSRTNVSPEKFQSVQLNNMLFRSNGTDLIRYTQDSGWVNWFQPGPNVGLLNAVPRTVGILNGEFSYRVSYYRNETVIGQAYIFESKPSDFLASVTATNQQIRVRSFPTPDSYWTGLILYRKGGLSPEWRKVTSWTTASVPAEYFDNIAETALLGVMQSAGNASPPRGRLVCLTKNNYIFISGIPGYETRIAWNKALIPLYFPDIDFDYPHFEDVDKEDGLPITAIYPYMDGVFIFKYSKCYYFPVNAPPYDKNIMIISNSVGCIAEESIKEINGDLYWQGYDGVYMYSPGMPTPQRISRQVDIDTGVGMLATALPSRKKAVAAFDRKFTTYWLSMMDFGTSSQRTWVYNTNLPNAAVVETSGQGSEKLVSKWSQHTFGFTAEIELPHRGYNIITGDAAGYYWREQMTNTDNRIAVNMVYEKSWHNFGILGIEKQIVETCVGAYVGDEPLTVETYVDFKTTHDTFTLGGGGAHWDVDFWDHAYFADGEGYIVKATPMPQETIGNFFKVKFFGQNCLLSSIEQVVTYRRKRLK